MFTGLIEDLGRIKQKGKNFLSIESKFQDVKIGDSVAVNGVCLTITQITRDCLKFDVMPATFLSTNLKRLKTGDFVNLERALKIDSRLGGHIVQGHVETVGKLMEIKSKDNAKILKILVSEKNILENIVAKGSIALDGISLTVTKKSSNNFSVSVIPETWLNTNLKCRKIGDFLNLETDFLLKNLVNRKNSGNQNFLNLLQNEGFL